MKSKTPKERSPTQASAAAYRLQQEGRFSSDAATTCCPLFAASKESPKPSQVPCFLLEKPFQDTRLPPEPRWIPICHHTSSLSHLSFSLLDNQESKVCSQIPRNTHEPASSSSLRQSSSPFAPGCICREQVSAVLPINHVLQVGGPRNPLPCAGQIALPSTPSVTPRDQGLSLPAAHTVPVSHLLFNYFSVSFLTRPISTQVSSKVTES